MFVMIVGRSCSIWRQPGPPERASIMINHVTERERAKEGIKQRKEIDEKGRRKQRGREESEGK